MNHQVNWTGWDKSKLAFSFAGRYSERDGFVKQLNPDLSDQADENRRGERAEIKYTPNDDWSFVLSGDYTRLKENFNFATVRITPVAPDGATPDFFNPRCKWRV